MHNHVIAAVTALLLVADIVLDFDQLDIGPAGDETGNSADILGKLTDDAYARNVFYLLFHFFRRDIFLCHLVEYAGNAFDTSGHMLDRAVLPLLLKFSPQGIKFQNQFVHSHYIGAEDLMPHDDIHILYLAS